MEPFASSIDGSSADRTQATDCSPSEVLVEASGTLLSSLQVSSVLPKILSLAKRLISADAYAVWINDDATKTWRIAACEGLSDSYRAQDLHHSGGAITERPIVVPDVRINALLIDRRSLYEREGIRSLLIVPLIIQDATLGTISFYCHAKREFSENDVQHASALANLAAVALRTAELYESQEWEKRRSAFLVRRLVRRSRRRWITK